MPPEYLHKTSDETWNIIKNRITSAERIVLLLDYDGTLTPICKSPECARLSDGMRMLLEILSTTNSIIVAFVTGRSYLDIRKMLNLKNVIYVSNHGFQITWGKKRWVHPKVKNIIAQIQNVSVLLRDALSQFYLTILENKKYTLTVHYRNEEKNNVQLVSKIIKRTIEEYLVHLKITRGKKVFEVRPRILWSKGHAVQKLLKILKNKIIDDPLVIYIGDDKTDEDAFMLLPESAITVRVGVSQKTSARFFVKNIKEVEKLLEVIKTERCNS